MQEAMKQRLVRLAAAVGFDKTHLTRAVAYRAVDAWLDGMGANRLDALEISAGWKWRERQWGSFAEMNWPDHDICNDVLDRRFDIIIADNVWEHLPFPYRAARNVHAMLRPGGWFVNITPFMIRRHDVPLDCSRWTEMGMRYLLEDAGFDHDSMTSGSWGNASAVKANLVNWSRVGWRRSFPNDSRFPLTVWAMAQKL
jgi:SAM-dependent methyltransferase